MKEINLNEPHILSSSEACFLWGIDDSYLRKKTEEFPKGTIRRVGKQWIVTPKGMEAVFGKPNPKQRISKEKILELIQLVQELLEEEKATPHTSKVKDFSNHLRLQEFDRTFINALVEAALGKYDVNLLIGIFATEKEGEVK